MYRISARQILLIAFSSAFIAAGVVFFFERYGSRLLEPSGNAFFTENAPAGLTSPSARHRRTEQHRGL